MKTIEEKKQVMIDNPQMDVFWLYNRFNITFMEFCELSQGLNQKVKRDQYEFDQEEINIMKSETHFNYEKYASHLNIPVKYVEPYMKKHNYKLRKKQ